MTQTVDVHCLCGRKFAFDQTFIGSLVMCPSCGRMTQVARPREGGKESVGDRRRPENSLCELVGQAI